MTDAQPVIARVAQLLRDRNAIDQQLAAIIRRPALTGHLGEWIASQVFDIALEPSATNADFDGRFRSGPLRGQRVNVKFYGKQEGLLDIARGLGPDYYLVLTGPRGAALSSLDTHRPHVIESVYLFKATELLAQQRARGVKLGVASSVRAGQWRAAEIFPQQRNPLLPLTPEQIGLLGLFKA